MVIKVSFDMTPAIGNRTGIGNVVAHLFDSISASDQIELAPYTLNYKARPFQNDLPENNVFIN